MQCSHQRPHPQIKERTRARIRRAQRRGGATRLWMRGDYGTRRGRTRLSPDDEALCWRNSAVRWVHWTRFLLTERRRVCSQEIMNWKHRLANQLHPKSPQTGSHHSGFGDMCCISWWTWKLTISRVEKTKQHQGLKNACLFWLISKINTWWSDLIWTRIWSIVRQTSTASGRIESHSAYKNYKRIGIIQHKTWINSNTN